MQRLKIINLSVQSSDARTIEKAINEFRDETGCDIDLFFANADAIDEDPLLYHELVERTKDADLVLMRCMTEPARMKRFAKYESVLRDSNAYVYIYSGNMDVRLLYRDLFKGNDQDYILIGEFMKARGQMNDRGIICWLYSKIIGPIDVPEPKMNRESGIYHPDFDRDVSLEEYLRRNIKDDIPTIGLMFPATLWIFDNLDHIDYLIREIERQGMNVIPVFFSPVLRKVDGTSNSMAVVRDYMMDGDRKRIDVLIMAAPFSQLNSAKQVDGIGTPDEQNFFHTMTDVPVIQTMNLSGHFMDYEETTVGLSKNEFMISIIWPELDGQIISVPFASNENSVGGAKRYSPLEERIHYLVDSVGIWARLSRKKPEERKVAIMLWQSRPESGRIGGAAGLDSIESVNDMLIRLDKEGYTLDHVPENGKALINEILDNITNDLEYSSPQRIREKAVDMIDKKRYLAHYEKIPDFNKKRIEEKWGAPPGNVTVEDGKIVIPGLMNGNIFIGFQPLRSWSDQLEAIYHDPVMPMPHSYLAYYRWLRYDFKVDMIFHIGTHGTLEWLPGKSIALSQKCFPNLVLEGIPNIYPYIIDDPGEGIICKRRSESVLIGHMCPTMIRGGTYEELSSIENPLQEYFKAQTARDERKVAIRREILEAIKKADMFEELKIPADVTAEELEPYLANVHDYINDVKDALVRDGLHILGRAPEGELLDETVYGMMRLRNGKIPSLRDSFIKVRGYDTDTLKENPSQLTDGITNSEILDGLDEDIMSMLRDFRSVDYDIGKSMDIAEGYAHGMDDDLRTSVRYTCETLVPNLRHMTDEMDNMMHGLNGGYIVPGPAGAPTRGNAHILPMGRNYYGVDPEIVPTPASWEIGKKMADQMIKYYMDEKGCYPKEIAFIIWATDTMKNNGDDVAYILWLMGVKPVWSDKGGQVIDLEVIPLKELGRPRIDVTVRITGLFRDAFPNLIDLIDDAVKLVAELDESDDDNYLAANLRKDIVESIADGLSIDEARMVNSVRIFGCPPGAYGPGINHAIEAGNWKTVQDLADVYIAWGSHAYGRGMSGVSMKDQFIKRFSKVGITVKNMPDREIDLLDIDDVYGYLGGLNSFVKAYGKQDALSVMGDGSNPDKVKLRSTKDELQYVFRTKVLNPKFIEGLKRHGYRGVAQVANLTEYTFGWDATSDVVDDWMYEKLADKYLFDPDTKQWMMDENPHAMMEIMNRLMEAYERGMWDMKPETLEKMKELFLELEERIEEVNDR